MRCWKLVSTDTDGKFFSSNATGDLRVEYEVGKWARAPVGGLLVFKKPSLAHQWDKNKAFHLFECEVLGKVKLPPQRADMFDLLKALRVWEMRPRTPWEKKGWPCGSLAFRLVKLLPRQIDAASK